MATQQSFLAELQGRAFDPIKNTPNKTRYGANTFNPPYGTTAHATNTAALVAIGAKVIRTGLTWSSIQTTVGGAYDFSVYDEIYADATAAGLTCIFVIETTPKAYNLQPYGYFASLPLPADVFAIPVVTDPKFTQLCADNAAFCAVVAQRYPLALLEINNEWATASGYWRENNVLANKPTVSAYGQYFIAAYNAIKAVSPSTIVAVGGLTAVTFWSGANATTGVNVVPILTALPGFQCDAWSIHPYTRGAVSKDPRWVNNPVRANSFSDIAAFQTSLVNNGHGSKQLWVTEFLDWGTAEATDGNAAIDGEQLQADGLYGALMPVHTRYGYGKKGAGQAGVTICCMYPLQDVPAPTVPSDSGMYTGDANGVITQKKSGAAFQRFTGLLPTYVAPTFPPALTSVSPNTEVQGAASQVLSLSGANFSSGDTVVFSNAGITVNSVTYVSPIAMTVNVTVSGAASVGAGTVKVHNVTNGDSNTVAFSVTSSTPAFHWAWVFQDAGDPIVTSPAYAIVGSDNNSSVNPFPYPQTVGGQPNWGLYGFTGTDHARTRDDTKGQLGGLEFQPNNGTQATLQIAVPNGTFDVNLALGDIAGAMTNYCYIYDNTTLLASIVGVAQSGTNVVNASGSVVTAAAWTFNTGKLSLAFSSGTCNVKFGSPTTQTNNSGLITFELNQTA